MSEDYGCKVRFAQDVLKHSVSGRGMVKLHLYALVDAMLRKIDYTDDCPHEAQGLDVLSEFLKAKDPGLLEARVEISLLDKDDSRQGGILVWPSNSQRNISISLKKS